jgi:hypothetical protein
MRRRIPATGHSFGGLSGILNGADFFHRCRIGTTIFLFHYLEKRSAAKVQTDPALRTFWTGADGNHLRTEWVAKYRTFPTIVERRAMRRSIFGRTSASHQPSAFGVGYLRVSFPGMSLSGISPSGISGHRLYMAGRPTSASRSNCIVTRKSVPSIFSSCQISRLREPPQLR